MLPQMKTKKNSVDMQNIFNGINLNFQISESEFSEMKNMTNDYFPALGNRSKRGIMKKLEKPMGMLGGQYLSYVDDNRLYYNESFIAQLEETNAERQMLMMGAFLCVFPDGLIFNTETKEISYIENEVTTTQAPTFTLCKLDGMVFDDSNTVTSDTVPEDKTKYWIDTSNDTVVIKIYSTNTSQWVSVGTTYVKVSSPGIGIGFQAYDAALFSGIDESQDVYNNVDLNQTNIIFDAADDYLVIVGFINKQFTNSKNITVKREMPKMDFVCELDNRIWGCSSKNHEIYASKLGDPKNFNFFGGYDSDSYAATIGTEDIFTGAIAYSGYVFFFKESGYHKIYGNKPSNFEIIWKPCRGVQRGSEKSLAVVNEMLMYKSRDAVCIFDGSVNKVSDNLGNTSFYGAVAGSYRDKYFISMRDADYHFSLFVYDTTKHMWVKEDDRELRYTAYADGALYMVDNAYTMYVVNQEKMYSKFYPCEEVIPDAVLFPGNSVSGNLEAEIEWSFTTGDMGMQSPYQKYIKRVDIRMWLDISSFLRVEVMYDSSDEWIKLMEYYATKKRSFDMPLVIQRCDHFRLRFSGHGDMKLYSMAKITEQGTDASTGGMSGE